MLRIMLDTIDEGSSLLDLALVPEDLLLEFDGVFFTSDVSVNLKFYRQITKIYVKAVMTVDAEMECSRCLAKVPLKIKASAEVQYSPLPKFVEDQIDDIGIGYYTDEYIDITDELRESILLEIPMIILCSEDCKGLCSQCGQNLNIAKCDCPELENLSESKFAVLTKLLDIKEKLGV